MADVTRGTLELDSRTSGHIITDPEHTGLSLEHALGEMVGRRVALFGPYTDLVAGNICWILTTEDGQL